MKRTGRICAAVSVVLLAGLGCGSKDPTPPPEATGGAGGMVDDDGGPVGTGGSVGTDATPGTGDYYPFTVGNSWEYAVTQLNHAPENKTHKITKMEVIGGTGPFKDMMAYRVETQKSANAAAGDATISWQVREGNRVVRYRETSCQLGSVKLAADGSVDSCAVNEEDWWSPARVVLDEQPTNMPYANGLTWPENYMEWIVKTSFKISPPMPIASPVAQKMDIWSIADANASITTPAGTFNGCAIIKKMAATSATKTYTYCRGVGKVKEEGASSSSQTETLVRYTVL
jgi:hypothetical protein